MNKVKNSRSPKKFKKPNIFRFKFPIKFWFHSKATGFCIKMAEV